MSDKADAGLKRRLLMLALLLLGLIVLALAWTWSPMKEWLSLDAAVTALRGWGARVGPALAILAFAAAVSLAIPLTFLTLVALAALGPWMGLLCSVLGALLGAVVSYVLGRRLGFEALQHLGGARMNAISQRLAQRGLWAVVAVRMVPVAPFAVINLLAGATHLRLRDLLLGTAIGMMPSTLAMAFFTESLLQALREPTPLTYAVAAGTILLIALGGWALKRWLMR
jgi:uncharacterized membrane protein YdjX (TVP38/TMEM64 family)